MNNKIVKVLIVIVLLAVLGGLAGLLFWQDFAPKQESQDVPVHTAVVSKENIVSKVTSAAEVKGAKTEKLKMPKWRNFKSFVAPLDQKVPAGTPLVEFTNGQTLVAPYELVVRSWNLPENKWDELTADHFVEVTQTDQLHVEFDVHENDIGRLAIGQEASVSFASQEGKNLSGKIVKIDPVGTYSSTGAKYKVTVEVPNDGTIMLGMSANVKVITSETGDVLTVPVSAVMDDGEGPYVKILKADGSFKSVPVETGHSDGLIVEVSGDLAEGDQVVLNEVSTDQASSASTGTSDAG